MTNYTLRALVRADQDVVRQLVTESWGAPTVVVGQARVVDPGTLPGLVAEDHGVIVGLLTYEITGTSAEIVTLNAFRAGSGIGGTLMRRAEEVLRAQGITRIFLMTTNDNTDGLRFYQRLGYRLTQLRVNAIEASRKVKPEIPLTGNHGIPIRDELELELTL